MRSHPKPCAERIFCETLECLWRALRVVLSVSGQVNHRTFIVHAPYVTNLLYVRYLATILTKVASVTEWSLRVANVSTKAFRASPSTVRTSGGVYMRTQPRDELSYEAKKINLSRKNANGLVYICLKLPSMPDHSSTSPASGRRKMLEA